MSKFIAILRNDCNSTEKEFINVTPPPGEDWDLENDWEECREKAKSKSSDEPDDIIKAMEKKGYKIEVIPDMGEPVELFYSKE